MIEFSEFNLINSHYPTNHYDVIFCRNVLIYQPIENKQKILEKIYSSLKDEGVLILGNAESTVGIKTNLVPDKVNKTMVLVRPSPGQKSQTAAAS
jgi:chemotaxis protein methyltransferase CheR